MRPKATLLALFGTLSLVACGASNPEATSATDEGIVTDGVSVWTTSHPSAPFQRGASLSFHAPLVHASLGTIVVDDGVLRQEVDGFGAALTDASAAIMSKELSASARTELLKDLLSPTSGLGLSILRVPIAASDSTWSGSYSYDEDGPDPSLKHFTVAHDEAYIIPELEEILGSINPNVHVISTPWSPPGWMKEDNAGMIGGTLRSTYREAYAEYFVHFVRAYWEHRIPIYAITPQNEPGQAADYPSMTLSAADEGALISDFLAPALTKAHFAWVKIFGYDHNWGNPYPGDLLTALESSRALADLQGMSFHCYGGDPSGNAATMTTLHDDPRMRNADGSVKDIYVTECDRSVHDDGASKMQAEGIQKLIYAMNNWSRSYVAWQLVLHPDGTPDQGHGCMGNDWHCVGVVSVESASGKVTKEWDYAYLGHASKFVARGARVVSEAPLGPVESVAFVNPDGSRVLVAYNSSVSADETFEVEWHGQAFTAGIPKRSVATFRWTP